MRHTLLVLGLFVFASQAGGDPIKVSATVDGKPAPIGSLDVTVGKDKLADHLQGTFSIGKDYADLDKCYDFRWVNVVVGASLKGKAVTKISLVGDIPAIDPAPSDGPEPYYYNAGEWKSGKFGSVDIRKEGEFSRFSDSPNGSAKHFDQVSFWNFLVVDAVHDPKWKEKTFCVLAGYSWEYTSGTKWDPITKDYDDDVSAFGKELDLKDALKTINTAIGNASVGGDFKGWQAVTGSDLTCKVPSPGALALLALSGLVAGRRRR